MDSSQNDTKTIFSEDINIPSENIKALSLQQRLWIDYKAIGGYISSDDEMVPTKMTITEFAGKLGLDRETLYRWTKSIPDFWGLVARRRKELGSQERLIKVHDTWYLKALAGSYPHLQLWLANFDPDFRMPTEKIEHEAGSTLAELLNKSRERRRSDNQIQEGEVVNGPADADTRTS